VYWYRFIAGDATSPVGRSSMLFTLGGPLVIPGQTDTTPGAQAQQHQCGRVALLRPGLPVGQRREGIGTGDAGAAGVCINLGGDAHTMKVRGKKDVARFHAVIREKGQRLRRSKALRHFCRKCGSPLWLWDPRWPELIHPHASAIDTPLPKPPEVVEAALAYAPRWVDVPKGKGHVHCREWPKESLREWHERHRLLG
jgi:hypothetical protein